MTDYVYLDVFIEVRGRFWIIYQNFTNDVEMKTASYVQYISAVMNAQVGYACIILYNTAPLVVVVDRYTVTQSVRPCIFGGVALCEADTTVALHDLYCTVYSRNKT